MNPLIQLMAEIKAELQELAKLLEAHEREKENA